MILTTVWMMASSLILLSSFFIELTTRLGASLRLSVIISLSGLLLAFVPFSGTSFISYLSGFFGALTPASLIYLMLGMATPAPRLQNLRQQLLWPALITGLLLYPLSLSVSSLDPYEWGYAHLLMIALLSLSGLLILRYQPLVSWMIAAVLAAWGLRLSGSDNFWDYLVDPVIFCFALSRLILRPSVRYVYRVLRQNSPTG